MLYPAFASCHVCRKEKKNTKKDRKKKQKKTQAITM